MAKAAWRAGCLAGTKCAGGVVARVSASRSLRLRGSGSRAGGASLKALPYLTISILEWKLITHMLAPKNVGMCRIMLGYTRDQSIAHLRVAGHRRRI